MNKLNNFKIKFDIEFKKNYAPNLFSWKELEYLINIRPLMNTKLVHVPGSSSLTWTNDFWAADQNCYPPSLLKKLIETHICYFVNMSRSTKKINNFANEIELKYKSCTDAHIYICKDISITHPFGIHYDFCHNIIVQCEGVTNFKVWDVFMDKNENSNLIIDEPPFLDVEMVPGDAIFIPAYIPHFAESKTPRLSVSFPFPDKKCEYFQDRNWVSI